MIPFFKPRRLCGNSRAALESSETDVVNLARLPLTVARARVKRFKRSGKRQVDLVRATSSEAFHPRRGTRYPRSLTRARHRGIVIGGVS